MTSRWIAFVVAFALSATTLHAQQGFAHWWLPKDYSLHGKSIDRLFTAIFIITAGVLVLVTMTLVVFLIRYRARPGRRARYIHGNTRFELAWTILPAVILAGLALYSKGVWDRYRYSPAADDPNLARILVIAQQFKWNVIYPGGDGKFGKYLVYPIPTDLHWPRNARGGSVTFKGVEGPAHLPYDAAVKAINDYISVENPLGKVFDDPDGLDDDFVQQPGRPIEIPVNRPIEVNLSSRDVIHDFFLPNFRVKLDAVPGMRGKLYFTATKLSAEREAESTQVYPLETLSEMMTARPSLVFNVWIDEQTRHHAADKDARGWRIFDITSQTKETIIRHGAGIPADPVAREERFRLLRKSGVKELKVYTPGYFDIVCEELCGAGHYTMQGQLYVISQDAYRAAHERPLVRSESPATKPGEAR